MHDRPLIAHLAEDGQGHFLGRRPHIEGWADAGGAPVGTGATPQQLRRPLKKFPVLPIEEGGKADSPRISVKKKYGGIEGVDP
jgi:hypothetical protein